MTKKTYRPSNPLGGFIEDIQADNTILGFSYLDQSPHDMGFKILFHSKMGASLSVRVEGLDLEDNYSDFLERIKEQVDTLKYKLTDSSNVFIIDLEAYQEQRNIEKENVLINAHRDELNNLP
jgi:hypothetical protein